MTHTGNKLPEHTVCYRARNPKGRVLEILNYSLLTIYQEVYTEIAGENETKKWGDVEENI